QCDGTDSSACASGQCTTSCTCIAPAGGLPDLTPQLIDIGIEYGTSVAQGDFAEGCAEATSGVTLLRFTVTTQNIGSADFFLGDPACPQPPQPLEVCGNPNFIWSPAQGHNHPHYQNFARYELLDSFGQALTVGHKQGFCLLDEGGGT